MQWRVLPSGQRWTLEKHDGKAELMRALPEPARADILRRLRRLEGPPSPFVCPGEIRRRLLQLALVVGAFWLAFVLLLLALLRPGLFRWGG